jgi:hypothetical protein
MCPMHQGMPANACGMSAASCCAIVQRESSSRNAMKPEQKTGDEFAVQVVATNSSSLLSPRPGPERRITPGLRFEKPVLELKTDLRV